MKKQIVCSVILGTFFVPSTGVFADTIDSTKDSSFVEGISEEMIESKQDVIESVLSAEMVEVGAIEESTLFTESEEINVPSEPELPEESTDSEDPRESEEATDSSSTEEIETPDETETPEVPSEPEIPDESEGDGTEQPTVPSEREEVAESTEESSIIETETTTFTEERISETSEIQENRMDEDMKYTTNSTLSVEDKPLESSNSQGANVRTLPKTGSKRSSFSSLLGIMISFSSLYWLKKRNSPLE